MRIEFSGEVVRDVDVAADYANLRELEAEAVHTVGRASWRRERLCSFDVDDALVTSGLLPVDLARGRLFLNQSYGGIEHIPIPYQPFRPRIGGGRFTLASEPELHAGSHVLIGGPIDEVWYHWLFNWAPRLLLLRKLRPDLWRDPGVRFVVQDKAMAPQYRAVLDAFGVAPERLTVVDLARDHRFERLTLLPFIHQDLLLPQILREFAAVLTPALTAGLAPARCADVFASRQALAAPKRRVDDFAALAPALAAHGVRVVDCGALSAAEQAQAFHGAARVVAGHGSDLANLMFCRPGTQVLVFEHSANIARGGHVLLRELCRLFDLRYDMMVPASTAAPEAPLPERLRADFRINVAAVDAWLARSAFLAEGVGAARTSGVAAGPAPALMRLFTRGLRKRA